MRGLGLFLGMCRRCRQGGAAVAPVNTAAPVATGAAYVGLTLTSADGSWTGSPAPTFTYQWQRFTGGVWVDIVGETAATYVVALADEGIPVRCVVTATNIAGSASEPSNAIEQWVPADAGAAPQHWFDAMDATTITIATGVSAWASKGSLGSSLVQATAANQPAYGAAAFNGKPGLTFAAGLSRLINETDLPTWRNTGYGSAHIALHPTTSAGSKGVIGASTPTANSSRLFYRVFNGNYQLIGVRDDADGLNYANGGAVLTAPCSQSLRQRWANATYMMRQNGNVMINSGRLTAGLTSDTDSSRLVLGTIMSASGDEFVGSMGEVLVYAIDLSDAMMDKIDGYLAWRWGMVADLPALHPYKTAAPTP